MTGLLIKTSVEVHRKGKMGVLVVSGDADTNTYTLQFKVI